MLVIVLQGEIGRRSGGDNVLEREGYAVSAGFSLGLVALGMMTLVGLIKSMKILIVANNFLFN